MSEYQYYEFLALDRPLTYSEQELLRGISEPGTDHGYQFFESLRIR